MRLAAPAKDSLVKLDAIAYCVSTVLVIWCGAHSAIAGSANGHNIFGGIRPPLTVRLLVGAVPVGLKIVHNMVVPQNWTRCQQCPPVAA